MENTLRIDQLNDLLKGLESVTASQVSFKEVINEKFNVFSSNISSLLEKLDSLQKSTDENIKSAADRADAPKPDNSTLGSTLNNLNSGVSTLVSYLQKQEKVLVDLTNSLSNSGVLNERLLSVTRSIESAQKEKDERKYGGFARDSSDPQEEPEWVTKMLSRLDNLRSEKVAQPKEEEKKGFFDSLLGWLTTIGGALLIGGLAVLAGFIFQKPLLNLLETVFGQDIRQKFEDFIKPLSGVGPVLSKFLVDLGLLTPALAKDLFTLPGKLLNIAKDGVSGLFAKSLPEAGKAAESAAAAAGGGASRIAGKLEAEAIEEGVELAGKTVGKTALKELFPALKFILKRIPIIGALISGAFAIKDFIDGDYKSAALNLLSGGAGLLDFVVPGLGSALSFMIDMYSMGMTYDAGGDINKKRWSGGLDGLQKMYKDMNQWMKKSVLDPILNMVPDIGPLKNWAAELLGLEKSPESENSPMLLKNKGLPTSSGLEKDPNLLEKPLGNIDLPPSNRNAIKDGIEKENVLLNDVSNQVIFLLKQFGDQMEVLTSKISNIQPNVSVVAPSTTNNISSPKKSSKDDDRRNMRFIPAMGY